MKVTVGNLFSKTAGLLERSFTPSEASWLAARLFEHFVQLSPAKRVLASAHEMQPQQVQLIVRATAQLLRHVPWQYVTGNVYFLDLELEVSSDVLIPRPETEELVNMVIGEIEKHSPSHVFTLLDIGTGSGCIAIALKKRFQEFKLFACDVSEKALDIAKRNALRHGADIQFISTDILNTDHWEMLPNCDIIISNPPYVTESEKKQMQPNVLDYEPHKALFVPDHDPLLFYRSIVAFAEQRLNTGGQIWFEINESFGNQAREMLSEAGYSPVNIFSDFREKARFLHASKKN